MADVIDFGDWGVRSEDSDADATLESLKGRLQAFVLIGYDHDGNELRAITFAHLPEALWALERGKKSILESVDAE